MFCVLALTLLMGFILAPVGKPMIVALVKLGEMKALDPKVLVLSSAQGRLELSWSHLSHRPAKHLNAGIRETIVAVNSDLVTQNLTLNPISGNAGSTVNVSFTIKNQGSGAAGQSTCNVRIAISATTVTTSDPLLFQVNVPTLAAGATYNVNQNTTIPAGRAAGQNYIWVIEDVNNAAGQGANTGNDYAQTGFTVTSANSDLVTQNLTLNPTSGNAGSTVNVSFTIKNQGSGAAGQSTCNVRIAISATTVTTSDPLLFQVNVPTLAAGATYNVNQNTTIPAGRAAGQNYIWVIEDVNNAAGQGANTGNDYADAPFIVKDESTTGAFYMSFPLHYNGWNSTTAEIVSVFDHSMTTPYCPDSVVTAYTGESGTVRASNEPPSITQCGTLYSYKKPDGQRFSINGNYVGTLQSGPAVLNYDGHAGIDYRVPFGTDVFAAAEGDVVVADASNSTAAGRFIRLQHGDYGYQSQYLHLSELFVSVGQHVMRGQLIGRSGNFGGPNGNVSPHLHFETKRLKGEQWISVDPYGWTGSGSDPYVEAMSVNLWQPETQSCQNPSEQQIADYSDQLSLNYKIPSIIIKALVEQESDWQQCGVIHTEPDGRIGIGLTQVTVVNTSNVTLTLGLIQEGVRQESNPFTTTTQQVSVDVGRLKTDWQYNLEVGTRLLVAAKKASGGAGDDASILENWYYPLAYFNGATKYDQSNPKPFGNDPSDPNYSRLVSTNGEWKDRFVFPYQECVFNIVAQLYQIPATRRVYFGNPIKVTLPGPSRVLSGAGQYNYVESAFCFFDWAQYFDDGTVRVGNWGSKNNGCIPLAKTATGIAFHKIPFGSITPAPAPSPTPTPGSSLSTSYSLSKGLNLVSFPFTPSPARFADLFSQLGTDLDQNVFYVDDNGNVQIGNTQTLIAEAKKGYFLYLNNPRTITISGNRVDTGITLRQGINLIGVNQQLIPTGNANIYPYVFYYEGDSLKAANLFSSTLQPGIAYFVYSQANGTVLVTSASSSARPETSWGNEEDSFNAPVVSSVSSTDFSATLTVAQSSANSPSSQTISFGVKPTAIDGYDEGLDQVRLPPLPGQLTAFFNENFGLDASYKNDETPKDWPLVITSETAFPGKSDNLNPVQLSWTIPSAGFIPSGSTFQLLDANGSVIIADMRTTTSTSFAVSGPGTERRYMIRMASSSVTPSPTPGPSPTPTPSVSPSPSPAPSPSASPSPSLSPSPSASPSPSPSPSPSASPLPPPSPTPPSVAIQFSAALYTTNETDGSLNVTVNRSGDTSASASVGYATSNGTAKEGRDYVAASGALNFAAGDTSKTFPILIIDNAYVDGGRTVNLTLSNPSGATLSTQSTAVLTINDNDSVAGTNPLDVPRSFVSLDYYDFLGRYPDQSGWDFWTNQITSCGSNVQCIEVQRINVSASFFLSIEFQQTGYLVERFYKAAYGDATGSSTFGGNHQLPVPRVRFDEFLKDSQRIGRGVVVLAPGWEQLLETNKQAYAGEFVQTSRFLTAFPATMTPAQFVDTLNQNAGTALSSTERTAAINLFAGAGDTANSNARAQAVRQVAEDTDLYNAEFNRAFVLAQYFGYLRRNPNDPQDTDYTGYDFWLTKLNQFNGNYINAEMVKAFLSSIEYRQRFGP
jgi:murein DD-endopeptidase MepM/ murein hydrolase activator NlpD